jgi:hypothetical protein
MASAGLVILMIPHMTFWLVLPLILGTSIGSNVLLVATITNRTLGYGDKTRGILSNILPCRVIDDVMGELTFGLITFYQRRPSFSWLPL